MRRLDTFDAAALRTTIITFRDAVRTHAERINRLNVYPVPDGDTGTNMARTLDAVVDELESAGSDCESTCDAISHGSLMGARGNSGVILSQIIRGLVSALRDDLANAGVTATALAEALDAAAKAAYQAVLKPIEGTILTVARESADAAGEAARGGSPLVDVVRAARDRGHRTLERTPELLPVLKDAGVVDAGGAGYLLLLDAWVHVLSGEPVADPDDSFQAPAGGGSDYTGPGSGAPGAQPARGADGEVDVSDLRYEVMYFLEIADDKIEAFKSSWGEIGDSIVVVGGDGLWNCHVHTDDIGAAVEVALDLDGRPSRIRITDLFEEVADEHARRDASILDESARDDPVNGAAEVSRVEGGASRNETIDSRSSAGLPRVTTAVVAVASGGGLEELFSQLGVQGVVTGGQTMNPSTAELLDVVERVNADHVVVLPNNKNIIAVAQQVDSLTAKTVVVVPTKTMPEGLAALIVYDPELDAAANAAEMTEAASGLVTGEITRAVRPASTPAGDVNEGDWIALVGGEGIVSASDSLPDAATGMLERIVADDHEIATIVTGDGASDEATAAMRGWFGDHRADIDVEIHHGGQPLYPYLVGIE